MKLEIENGRLPLGENLEKRTRKSCMDVEVTVKGPEMTMEKKKKRNNQKLSTKLGRESKNINLKIVN